MDCRITTVFENALLSPGSAKRTIRGASAVVASYPSLAASPSVPAAVPSMSMSGLISVPQSRDIGPGSGEEQPGPVLVLPGVVEGRLGDRARAPRAKGCEVLPNDQTSHALDF